MILSPVTQFAIEPIRKFEAKNLCDSLLLASILIFLFTGVMNSEPAAAQHHGYWQQEVDYVMDIDVDVDSNQFAGRQTLTYHNNSPDTLNRAFYHLFFNAFQPNSMMDKRSRTIADPDRRVRDKIKQYNDTEIGYQEVNSLSQNGREIDFTIKGTIMEAHLAEPILPGESVEFEMDFHAQVPLQTRRSGRDNAEGIRLSMAQWYPKMAAYDKDGWHPNPYISREFYAPFGSFDVTIHIDRNYVVAANSILQNPEEVGYGYETPDMQVNRSGGEKLTWNFKSENVHDFMWAADPDYTQTTAQVPGGPLLRFFYQTDNVAENADDDRQEELLANWQELPEYTVRAFEYMNANYGEYPYDEYITIQGGDGGMEYTMGTLITGNRSLRSLVSVTVHELIHAWYEGSIANNETKDQWIDEGFTAYLSAFLMNELFDDEEDNPLKSRYNSYFNLVEAGFEEPMHIHADHYYTNTAYSMASYTKGAIFLHQLGYIIGKDVLKQTLNRFYEEWKFKHPAGRDFLRIAERESGMVLDWYYEYWIETTKTIDYGISGVEDRGGQTLVTMERIGLMPMPLDVEIKLTDGSIIHYYVPMRIMWGEKDNEFPDTERIVADDWPWVFPEYELTVEHPIGEILRIEIDPTQRMADIDRSNNTWDEEES